MLQELSQADKEEVGRVPRTLEVELTRDLVGSCSAGDVITALGIVKVIGTDAEAGTVPWCRAPCSLLQCWHEATACMVKRVLKVQQCSPSYADIPDKSCEWLNERWVHV